MTKPGSRGAVGAWESEFPGTFKRYDSSGFMVAAVTDRGLNARALVSLYQASYANECRCVHEAAAWCDEMLIQEGFTLEGGAAQDHVVPPKKEEVSRE
jgi:hypothetical protein